MADKTKKTKKEKKVSSQRNKTESSAHEFETMSQIQNRYGKGRQQSGSDGSSSEGRGSNH